MAALDDSFNFWSLILKELCLFGIMVYEVFGLKSRSEQKCLCLVAFIAMSLKKTLLTSIFIRFFRHFCICPFPTGWWKVQSPFTEVPWTDFWVYDGLVPALAKRRSHCSCRSLPVPVQHWLYRRGQETGHPDYGYCTWWSGGKLCRILPEVISEKFCCKPIIKD